MGVAYTGTRDEPVVASSGNTPTFAGDLTTVSAFYAARSLRRFTTVALLLASSGSTVGDAAVAENALGAVFIHTGSGWFMHGTPRYADAAARDAALTAPVAGWRARITTELFDRQWVAAGVWAPAGPPSTLLDPSSVAGTGVTESGGTATLAGAATAGTINGVFSAAYGFEQYLVDYDLTTAGAGSINMFLTLAGAAAATAYDNQRDTSISNVSATVRTANVTSAQVDTIGIAARHKGTIILTNPHLAAETEFLSDYSVRDATYTTASGTGRTKGRHRTATAYDGVRLEASTGTMAGTIKVFGIL